MVRRAYTNGAGEKWNGRRADRNGTRALNNIKCDCSMEIEARAVNES